MESLNTRRTICFFDSGIGGLNVMRECEKYIKDADFIYFADNYRVPYGNLTENELFSFADVAFSEIEKSNPAAAVIACNTVTAVCVEKLRKKYSFPIIGIQPAVKPAAAYGENCVVLATPATAESRSLKNLVARYGNGVTKICVCPGLADYVERNIFYLKKDEIISLLPKVKTDGVILGCTHYSFISEIISDFYSSEVYDGKEGVARRLAQILGKNDHFLTRSRKITFIGGDTEKNKAVYSLICKGEV